MRLLAAVERDVKRSTVIPHGKHALVWKRIDGQRADPEILSCLNAYLTRGDFAAARAKLHVRFGQLLRFGDPAIDDQRIVELVVRSIEDNLLKAPLSDRDAMRLELALTRAAIADLGELMSTDIPTGRSIALEEALVPVGPNVTSPARLMRARSGVWPYAAREGVLAQLDDWMTGPAAFSVCLIGGRGGSGKTRLGVELARRASRAGRLSGMLTAASPDAIEALVRIEAARLIVVDYAETRGEQLEVLLPWLVANATQEHPVRVLLLVRAGPRQGSDWTGVLRHRSDALLQTSSGSPSLRCR